MTVSLQVVLIGALTGLGYAVLAVGLVLIFRATRVINFAHGEMGAFGAAVLAKLVLDYDWPFFPTLLLVLCIGGVIGAVVELGIIRRLFNAPRLIVLVATIGVSQVLFFAQAILPGIDNISRYPSPLDRTLQVGDLLLRSEHFMAIAVIPAVIVGLALFMTRTPYGVAIRAAAENSEAAQLAGIRVKRVSTLVWVLAAVLGTLSAVLINPLRGIIVGGASSALGPGLLLRALAAGLIGRLHSLPLALVGGVVVGIGEALMFTNLGEPGIVDVALFLLVLGLVWRQRGQEGGAAEASWSLAAKVRPIPERLKQVWWVRRLNWLGGGAALLVGLLLPLVFSASSQQFLFSRVLLYAIVGLSLTVLLGWAGQLSLGQFAFVGLGSMTAAALVGQGMPFFAAVFFGTVAGVLVALAVGGPALRIRGLSLAITTLAFAVAARGWLFSRELFLGDGTVVTVPRATLGPLDLSSSLVYYYLSLFALAASVLALSRLRSSGVGRTLIAVRDNAPSAAAFTVSPAVAKLSAFAVSGALAALAGGLLAGLRVQFGLDAFSVSESLRMVAMTVIGGVGSVAGSVLGAIYVLGVPAMFQGSVAVALLTSGIGLLILLLYFPGGLAQLLYKARDAILDAAERKLAREQASQPPQVPGPEDADQPEAVDQPESEDVVPAGGGPSGNGQVTPETTTPPATPAPAGTEPTGNGQPAGPVPPAGEGPVTELAASADGADGVASFEALLSRVALQVNGVTVTFGGRTAVDGVSLTALKGEMIGLIGANGAGKSTLLNVISGFVTSERGTIHLLGKDVTAMPSHARAAVGLGRVFQDARLFGGLTVLEAVKVALEARERSELVPSMLWLPPAARAERWKHAESVELIDFLGLGRYANSFASELSTGTRRIAELACLLALQPRVVLLDEPTAGVAQRETEAFGPLLGRIRRELDATMVVIEHDMPLIMAISDRVYCLDAGAVIAEGAPKAVRDDPAVVAAYLGTDERAIERSDTVTGDPTAQPAETGGGPA